MSKWNVGPTLQLHDSNRNGRSECVLGCSLCGQANESRDRITNMSDDEESVLERLLMRKSAPMENPRDMS